MMDKPWRVFTRKPRPLRRMAIRGEQYDGSRWELQGRYATKEKAQEVIELLRSRSNLPDQYKIMHQSEGKP